MRPILTRVVRWILQFLVVHTLRWIRHSFYWNLELKRSSISRDIDKQWYLLENSVCWLNRNHLKRISSSMTSKVRIIIHKGFKVEVFHVQTLMIFFVSLSWFCIEQKVVQRFIWNKRVCTWKLQLCNFYKRTCDVTGEPERHKIFSTNWIFQSTKIRTIGCRYLKKYWSVLVPVKRSVLGTVRS